MNILTFDIEEWFHCDFISGTKNWSTYPSPQTTDFILDTAVIAAPSCIVSGAAAWDMEIRKIYKEGHEIGCHSMKHELVHRLNPQQFREDTQNALNVIEQVIGEKVNMYRAPAFSITKETPWAFEILHELGITHDASVFPAKHDYGGFPSFGNSEPSIIETNGVFIKEFPMNTLEIFKQSIVFSGGGFFRLFPYNLIKKWTTQSDYIMTYFHPRDFDNDQPMLQHLPLIRKFKSYYGLKGSGAKFDRYLSDFKTTSVLDVSKNFDWTKAKKIII